ncbi:sugar transferase [Marinomonas sp.]
MGLFDTGYPFFTRTSRHDKKPFVLVKFLSMVVDTVSMVSHLASTFSISKLRDFFRRTKLDQLPQWRSVLKVEMNLEGTRRGLLSQIELTQARNSKGGRRPIKLSSD